MSQLLSNYIFKKMIAPIDYKLCVLNETSNVLFIKSESIKIRELKENGVTLEAPINICQKGHSLTLYFLSSESTKKISLPYIGSLKDAKFEAIAKVEKIELSNLSKGIVIIDLHFTQYIQEDWKQILKLYSQNQDEINNLIMIQHRTCEKI